MKKLLYKMNENHTNQQGLTLEEIAVHKQALKNSHRRTAKKRQ